MALIKCPECGHEVSDYAQQCPSCGVQIADNIVVCPDCGKILLKKEKSCPNCGCALTPSDEPTTRKHTSAYRQSDARHTHPDHNERKGNTALWIVVIAIIVVLGAGAGGYWLYMTKAAEERMSTAYEAVKSSNSENDLQQFLADYPNSPYDAQVKTRLEQLKNIRDKWVEISMSSSKSDYVQFMTRFPNSAYEEACKSRIDSLDWIEVSTENTAVAYQRYIDVHPTGRYVAEARTGKENIDKMTVDYSDKYAVRTLLVSYLNALSNNDHESLNEIVTDKLFTQSIGFMEKLHSENRKVVFTAVTPAQVSKAPSPETGYVFIAKCEVERSLTSPSGETTSTHYNTVCTVSPDKRIINIKMTPDSEADN